MGCAFRCDVGVKQGVKETDKNRTSDLVPGPSDEINVLSQGGCLVRTTVSDMDNEARLWPTRRMMLESLPESQARNK